MISSGKCIFAEHQDLLKPSWQSVYRKLSIRYNGNSIAASSYCEPYMMSAGLEAH